MSDEHRRRSDNPEYNRRATDKVNNEISAVLEEIRNLKTDPWYRNPGIVASLIISSMTIMYNGFKAYSMISENAVNIEKNVQSISEVEKRQNKLEAISIKMSAELDSSIKLQQDRHEHIIKALDNLSRNNSGNNQN